MEADDSCRICRAGAEDDAPLYHPCKCSGSIAKVHQDCLIEWLQHSKKKSCELCNTELRFHKVYSSSMPAKLPNQLYLRRFLHQAFSCFRLALRALLVAIAWLALLPLGNVYVWRLHFWVVDVLVWGLTGGQPPLSPSRVVAHDIVNSTITSLAANAFSTLTQASVEDGQSAGTHGSSSIESQVNASGEVKIGDGVSFPLLPVEKLLVRLYSTPDYKKALDALVHDTFEGQILTCAIVVLFVALFLLREWCLQNLPQQVEELDQLALRPAPLNLPDEHVVVRDQLDGPRIAANAPLGQVVPIQQVVENQPPDLVEVSGSRVDALEKLNQDDIAKQQLEDPSSLEDLRLHRARWFEQHAFVTSSTSSSADVIETRGQKHEPPRSDASSSQNAEKGKGKARALEEHDESRVVENDNGNDDDIKREQKIQSSSSNRVEGTVQVVDESSGEQSPARTFASELRARQDIDEVFGAHSSALVENMGVNANAEDEDDNSDGALEEHIGNHLQDANSDGVVPAEDGETERDGRNDGEWGALMNQEHLNDNQQNALDELADWEEDPENGERLEDDLEGMMEAIGMRGPFTNLITNMTMMFVLCSFILTIFVALPYNLGRLLGVGRKPLHLSLFPLRIVWKIVGPFKRRLSAWVNVDTEHSHSLYLPSISNALPSSGRMFSQLLPSIVAKTTWALNLYQADPSLSDLCIAGSFSKGQGGVPCYIDYVRLALQSLGSNIVANVRFLISYTKATLIYLDAKTEAKSISDRTFCVVLGHLHWLIGLAIQKKLERLYLRWNLRSLKTFVDQQIVVLKVLAFIILELVVFPLGCGILADIALFPLWEKASLGSRFMLIQSRPLSVTFTLWSLGTLYMFALAQFVAHTRSIVRPGVLCFVRDAGDPNFHPIKDILERRSFEQLRKIGISGLIYSAILFGTVGFCVRLIDVSTVGVLPLKWQTHQAFSSAGIELVSIATVLPIAIKAWLPAHLIRRCTRRWWRWTAQKLRLSSYLIGGRFPSEEGRLVWPSWSVWIRSQVIFIGLKTAPVSDDRSGAEARQFKASGGYARVPADDQAIMTSPLVIRTDAKGDAVDARGHELLKAQEEAIAKMTKKPQYTIVYLPPNFRTRIVVLIVLLWLTLCSLLLVGLLPPLLVGRSALSILTVSPSIGFHDGYAWFLGFALLGILQTLAAKAQRMFSKLRTSSNAPRRFSKHARRFLQRAYLIFLFGFVTSTLLGLCVEAYVNGLTRIFVGKARMPDISILHAWSTGVLEQQFILEILRIRLGRTFRPTFEENQEQNNAYFAGPFLALLELQNGGWRRPKAMLLTRRAFLPSLALQTLVLLAPFALLRFVRIVDDRTTDVARGAQVSLAFFLCLAYICSGVIAKVIARQMDSWTDLLKDEHFLVSTELKNYLSDDDASSESHRHDRLGLQDELHNHDLAPNAHDRFNAEGPIPDALLHGGGPRG